MTSSPGLPDGLTGRRGREAPHRQVQRARALLMAADGVANTRIAASLGVTAVTVRAWRTRFAEKGLAKLGEVREGRGPKPSISAETGGGDRRGDPAFQIQGRDALEHRDDGQTVGGEPVHGAKDLARTGVWHCSRREFRPYPPSSETVFSVTVFPTWARVSVEVSRPRARGRRCLSSVAWVVFRSLTEAWECSG